MQAKRDKDCIPFRQGLLRTEEVGNGLNGPVEHKAAGTAAH